MSKLVFLLSSELLYFLQSHTHLANDIKLAQKIIKTYKAMKVMETHKSGQEPLLSNCISELANYFFKHQGNIGSKSLSRISMDKDSSSMINFGKAFKSEAAGN